MAFTVCIGPPVLADLGVHHTIIYDRIITNVGDHYSPNSGIFTVPRDGLYQFFLSANVLASHYIVLELVVDGNLIDDMLASALHGNDTQVGADMWVLELKEGSEVWVRTLHAGEVRGDCHTTFTGVLLH